MNELEFKVIAISDNTNSFGLRGYIVMNRDGVTYELARSDYNGSARWELNQLVHADAKVGNVFRFTGVEIPHEKPMAPQRIIDLVWGGETEKN